DPLSAGAWNDREAAGFQPEGRLGQRRIGDLATRQCSELGESYASFRRERLETLAGCLAALEPVRLSLRSERRLHDRTLFESDPAVLGAFIFGGDLLVGDVLD